MTKPRIKTMLTKEIRGTVRGFGRVGIAHHELYRPGGIKISLVENMPRTEEVVLSAKIA